MANSKTEAAYKIPLGKGMQHLIYSSERLQYED